MLYPLIDILRAVAVSLVMVYHVVGLGKWTVFSEPVWGLPFRQGWMGVDLFLVISGFVITLSAARDLAKTTPGFSWRFMQRRLRRLVPLYALTSLVFVVLVRPEILTRPAWEVIAQLVSHTLFIQNLFPLTHGVINGVTWSLALEMQFYLALVFGIRWILKLGPGRVLLLLVTLSWAWRYGMTLILKPGPDLERMMVIYTTQLPGTLDAFGMGIALALLIVKGEGWWARRLAQSWSNCLLWMVVAGLVLWIAGFIFLARSDYWAHLGMIVFFRTVLAIGFAASLAAAITCPLPGGGVLRPLRNLGQVSYGVYLWHFPLLLALLTLPDLRGARLFLSLFVGSVLLASFSWHLMEKHWVKVPRIQDGLKG